MRPWEREEKTPGIELIPSSREVSPSAVFSEGLLHVAVWNVDGSLGHYLTKQRRTEASLTELHHSVV